LKNRAKTLKLYIIHFEFFGLIWLSHHQEYLRFESAFDSVAMTPAKKTTTFVICSQSNCKSDNNYQIMELNPGPEIFGFKVPNQCLLAGYSYVFAAPCTYATK
jgi:hypothetical protein